jgi:hypothetical protein
VIGEELQPPRLVRGGQPFQKQAPEEAREHLDGKEEAGSAGNPMLPPGLRRGRLGREATPTGQARGLKAHGYDDMSVRMGVSADPQVCSTAVSPMRAPRCLGSAAMVIRVSAAVLSKRS